MRSYRGRLGDGYEMNAAYDNNRPDIGTISVGTGSTTQRELAKLKTVSMHMGSAVSGRRASLGTLGQQNAPHGWDLTSTVQ